MSREACSGLTAGAIAARFPCSRHLFEMRFREATGHSVLDEILHVRLEAVFTMLSQPGLRLGEIRRRAGFRSDLALQKLFRARTGTSMREWRRLNCE